MKTINAFSAFLTVITSLFVVHMSGAAGSGNDETAIRPFKAPVVPQSALDDLRRRVAATGWAEKETVDNQSQGAQLATMQKLAIRKSWRLL